MRKRQPALIINIISLLYLFGFSSTIVAETSAWIDLKAAQYLEKRTQCHIIFQDFKWKHQLWPETNNTIKPDRHLIIDDALIRLQVIQNLKREAAMHEELGILITDEMIAHEYNRIQISSKNHQKLKELYFFAR